MSLVWIFLLLFLFALLLGYGLACLWKMETRPEELQQEINQQNEWEWEPNESLSLVFLAPVRDCVQGLHYFRANLIQVKRAYPNTRVVFLENDSVDGTKEFIKTQFDFLDCTVIDDVDVSTFQYVRKGRGCVRVQRMCMLRNELMKHVTEKDDLMIPIDADWKVVWNMGQFQQALTHLLTSDAQAVVPTLMNARWWCPFQRYYFDSFAYSDAQFPELEYSSVAFQKLQQTLWKTNFKLSQRLGQRDGKPDGDQTLPQMLPFHPVESAFGSFAIYKRPAKDVIYKVELGQSGQQDRLAENPTNLPMDKTNVQACRCEHVTFNQQVGNIHLLPWFRLTP